MAAIPLEPGEELEEDAGQEAPLYVLDPHPDWEDWENHCRASGILPPAFGETFRPIVRERYPTITQRGWQSKFGISEDVLDTIWTRYFYKFLFYGVMAKDVLWVYNKLSTNETFDDMATNWASNLTSVFKVIRKTAQVLVAILDEVRAFCPIALPLKHSMVCVLRRIRANLDVQDLVEAEGVPTCRIAASV